jgi:murein DD-endopeptidase MepM/ murein hydrolase activator NlpD
LNIKGIKLRAWLLLLVGVVGVVALIWILAVKMEGEKPAVLMASDPVAIGESYRFSLTVSDAKSGLKKVWVGLLKDGKESVLMEKNFSPGRFYKRTRAHEESFDIQIEPKKLGISDGEALLRVAVWDFSWKGWLRGNNVYLEKEVLIDTRPPEIDVLTRRHNIAQGGSGLVVYRVSEPCPLHGVAVGNHFFPGKAGHFKDKKVYMTFIALDYSQGKGTEMYVKAKDFAGNSVRKGFPHYIRKKKFRKDAIPISDKFLAWKMPEFELDGADSSGGGKLNKFLRVNRELRKESYQKIIQQLKEADAQLRWKGAFGRLPGSARQAAFADHRIYKYKGRVIDRQVHQGVDLASLAQSPVPAANGGRVAYGGEIGIYGKTVILDHGFGLFSMYSHLSSIKVQSGQVVGKGEIIGRTGMTGLAGGDHLHFGVLVHQVFVDPVEWWDSAWITNNVLNKIEYVKSRLAEE